ncbi:MAG TPA: TetR family transcriptional regulator [Marinobacter sp.]|uniref:TetR/AcrR family transcriptional regulator n=1 Tax=Marinobacter sp. TaxID=50741 RepID=UPI002D7F0D04|nr:TetR family transcriptional regulator [Marinobacter sp.]HET8800446.1 TetR family transcriptional regulator [Marinobacter sp.]
MARHARYDRKTALEKAIVLFWEKGYQGSSMKQIEQALDMRPGSIYATFGNKDGLFSEALATYAEQGGREMAAHMSGYESVLDGIQDYLRMVAADCGSGDTTPARACMIVKSLLESSHTQPAIKSQSLAIMAAIESSFTALLEQAKTRGELAESTDCSRLARLFQAQLVGLRAVAERELGQEALAQLADDMAGVIEHYRVRH